MTASAAMTKLAAANRLIHTLRPMGFEFSLDNVGWQLPAGGTRPCSFLNRDLSDKRLPA